MDSKLDLIIKEVQKVIVGKDEVIEKVMMAILSNGHILLDDMPGVGKTTLAVAVSRALGLDFGRIQFTPDVLPSDIVGFSVYNKDTGGFDYRPGIVTNVNLLLGDEINRTSSKTQSALLEAMEEGQVTVDGQTYALKSPFIVIATQNNVGTAGTQMLPYAQLDRFLVRLSIGYPDAQSQIAMMRDRQDDNPLSHISQVVSREELLGMQAEVRRVFSSDAILAYITELTAASRSCELIEVGISPRGAICIDRMAKARAYLRGRDYVVPEDVRLVMADVCAHRIILSQKARLALCRPEEAVSGLLESVKAPDGPRA